MEEREPVEHGHTYGHQKLRVDVRGCTDVLLDHAFGDKMVLGCKRRGKLALFGLFLVSFLVGSLFQSVQLLQDSSSFWRIKPHLVEQLRFGDKFHADGESFALLDVKTLACLANHSISIALHLQNTDNFLNIIVFLLFGHRSVLTEICTEPQRLAHCGRLDMEILLLCVPGESLERLVSFLAVDEDGAGHHTNGDSVGQHIQQRGLSGTGGAHQRGQRARLDPAVHVVQNSLWLLADLDVETHVSPVEDAVTGSKPAGVGGRSGLVLGVVDALNVVGRLDVAFRSGVSWRFEPVRQEKQHVSFLHGRFGAFHQQEVHSKEEDCKRQIDAPVPPFVLGVVFVCQGNVFSTGYGRFTSLGAQSVANGVFLWHARIARNKVVALELSSVELVCDQRLERVRDRIQIIDPSRPAVHVFNRNSKTGVEHEQTDQEHRRSHGLGQRAEQRRKRPHHVRHRERAGEVCEQIEEEMSRSSAEIHHKVEHQIEPGVDDDFIRNFGDDGRERVGRRVTDVIGVVRSTVAEVFSARKNSKAVAESKPLVELSQHWIFEPHNDNSAVETRLRSPPETPLTKSLPTFVSAVCDKPYIAM
ncbi:hypothetical protein OGATHE_001221 [Ogataea polymorpha]|uniref:Uncharacterized protein n=1 Tax=Ogataea polymorpha TaxID=460523 RepID=A0A9P8TFR9_9ASCO|nr:hypothetical protein OGATHE_001221 [Ogataea polymorpha]